MKKLLFSKEAKYLVFTSIFFLFAINWNFAQISITPGGGSAAVIAGIGGPGLTISNVSINCNSVSYGQFSNGSSSGLGVNTGLVLSTGNASDISGANSADDLDYCVGTTFSDPQLTGISSSATNDVCIIEFDVIPQCNNISITFVFGSDEYMNYVGLTYNDAFGFFVSGPNPSGGNYVNQNIAVLPNGTPVGIDNVNANAGSNPAYYINNSGQSNSFDGFTTVLTPSIAVTPCATYHFKLAIGDASDCAVDSGVLIDIIQCVSPWTVATSSTPANCGVNNGTATATVSGGIGPFTYSWSPSGGTGSTASGLAAGNYTVTVNDGLSCTPAQVYNVTVGSTGGAPNTTITPAGPFCSTAAAVNLTAATGGGTWSGTGITNASTGTFNPATAGPGSHVITYSIGGPCPSSSTTTIVVNTPTVPTFTQVAAICSGGSFILPTTSNNGVTGTWSPAINNTTTTTYTFTPTAGLCATTATMTVTVNPQTTPTFTQVAPICSGGSFTLPGTSNNGITGTWSPAINNTATTTYTFTPTAGQCATTTTMTVTVGPPTTPTFTQVPAICSGGSFTLPGTSNNGFTGTWSPAINNTATTTYTFTPTAGQCATTTTMTVTVNAPVTPTFTQVAAICSGGSFTLPGTSNNGITGTWAPAINNTTTTTYTFTPTAGQCATTATMTVTVNPIPTMTAPANIAACPGDNIAASNFTSNPAGATFAWTNSNTSTGLAASGTGNTPAFVAVNGTGSPLVSTVTITPTLNGCVGTSVNYNITVNDLFDATITPAGPICANGTPINLSAVDAGGTWSGTGITNASIGTFDPTVSGAGTFTVTYTIAGSCGSTDTENIIVNPIPVVDPITNVVVCDGDPVTASSFTSTPVGSTFAWTNNTPSIGLAASGTGNTPAFTASNTTGSPVTATVSVTPTLNGCIGLPVNYSITVNILMDATITPAGPLCESDAAINLTAVDPGGTWSGNGITNAAVGTFDPTVAGPGTHTITYTISGNCGDVQTTNVDVLPDADASINPAGPFCTNDPAIALTPVQTGGTWSGTGITNAALGIFDPSIAGNGTHTITYTITGQCGDSQTINIIVSSQLNATITPAGPFCADASAINLSAVDPGGTWSGNGITNAATGTFNPATAGPGTHTITYTIGGNCGDVQTTTIVVNPLPTVSFTPDIVSGCVPLTVTFTDNSSPVATSTLWTMSDGFISSSNGSVTHTFTSPGCYNVTLNVTSAQGCSSSLTQNSIVCVSGIPNADFTWGPTDATVVTPVINFTNTSTGATIYNWDFAGLGTSTATHPSFTFPNSSPGTYQVCLAVENATGCVDTTCQLIQIHDEFLIYVPNAFTPDNDGVNDIFLPIVNGHDQESYELMIFNRWGELIFQTQHSTVGWDGTYKGMSSQEDVYVWKIKAKVLSNNEQKEFIGHVSLLR